MVKNIVSSGVVCLLLAGCATPAPVVLPPEIIRVPIFMQLPPKCSEKAQVDLPVGSTAIDVIAKQKAAIDELEAQIERCFRSTSG